MAELRKRGERPVVIEHEPAEGDLIEAWEMKERGIEVRQLLLTHDNFPILWQLVVGFQQSSMFRIGDALVAGESKLGEEVWQHVGSDYAQETLRNAKWVAERIPLARRRALPFSYHQAVASLEPVEQDELLDLVEQKRRRRQEFHTADLRAIIKERKAARRPNQPVIGHNGQDEPTDEPADDEVADELELAREIAEEKGFVDAEGSPAEPAGFDIEALRGCIAGLKKLNADPEERLAVSERIRTTVGWAPGDDLLAAAEMAEWLVPDEWSIGIKAGERSGDVRDWEVMLKRGSRVAIGTNTDLAAALAEAGLAALISETKIGA